MSGTMPASSAPAKSITNLEVDVDALGAILMKNPQDNGEFRLLYKIKAQMSGLQKEVDAAQKQIAEQAKEIKIYEKFTDQPVLDRVALKRQLANDLGRPLKLTNLGPSSLRKPKKTHFQDESFQDAQDFYDTFIAPGSTRAPRAAAMRSRALSQANSMTESDFWADGADGDPGMAGLKIPAKRSRAVSLGGNGEGKIASFKDSVEQLAKAERVRGPGGTFVKKETLVPRNKGEESVGGGDTLAGKHSGSPRRGTRGGRGSRGGRPRGRGRGGLGRADVARGWQMERSGGKEADVEPSRSDPAGDQHATVEEVANEPQQVIDAAPGLPIRHASDADEATMNNDVDSAWEKRVLEQSNNGGWSLFAPPTNSGINNHDDDDDAGSLRSPKRARRGSAKVRGV